MEVNAILLLLLSLPLKCIGQPAIEIPLGIIYDSDSKAEIRSYVLQTIKYINNDMKKYNVKWKFRINEIDTGDPQDVVSSVCQQMKRGVLAMFGIMNPKTANTLKTFTNSYHMPFLTWSYPELSNAKASEDPEELAKQNYQLYFQPDLSAVIISLIKYYRWKKVFYLYNRDDALRRIGAILAYQTEANDYSTELFVRKISNVDNCGDLLKAIDRQVPLTDAKSLPNSVIIMIDLETKSEYMSFLTIAKELGLMRNRYHFILNSLNSNEFELDEFNRNGGANITGFSIVDYYNHNTIKLLSDILENKVPINQMKVIPYEVGLLIDSLMYFCAQIVSLIGNESVGFFGRDDVKIEDGRIYIENYQEMNCSVIDNNSVWPLGDLIYEKLINNDAFDGLSGPIQLNSDGHRNGYIMQINRAAYTVPITKIGSYYHDVDRFDIVEEQLYRGKSAFKDLANRKRVIVTIEDAPFYMAKNGTNGTEYEGYCVDLAHKIAEILNFTYELRTVRDKKFGEMNASGHWNGIVGELIRNEADMAIAPLTIISSREKVVDFSKPFMNIGISIMVKKPIKKEPSLLSFLEPMSMEIYLCVILAYTGVSTVLFIVSRFSPYEWRVEDGAIENDFTILNTVWFSLSAFLQQGIDILPRSVSGRLATTVWWFFTLILISSYTANLAAFLTAERMKSPIESAEDLVKHKGMRYGSVDSGSTKQFFRISKVPTYSKMWTFMNGLSSEVFVKDNFEGVQKVRKSNGTYAFLLESSVNEYLNERYPCDTMKVGDNLDSKGYGIATPVDSDIKEAINLAVLQLKEDGYLEELKTKWWLARSECGNTDQASAKVDVASQSALHLENFAGVFCLLIVGYAISVVIVILEIIYKVREDSKRARKGFFETLKSQLMLSINGYKPKALTERIKIIRNASLVKPVKEEKQEKKAFLRVPTEDEALAYLPKSNQKESTVHHTSV